MGDDEQDDFGAEQAIEEDMGTDEVGGYDHGFEAFDQEESLLDPDAEPAVEDVPTAELSATEHSEPGPNQVTAAAGAAETQPRPDVVPPPLALYRRYRPDTFDDLIGQDHVTEPLKRALVNNRVNHAYLFSGPRGCGKTTSARILARSLNCEQGPTPTPCGQCQSCRDLARGGPGSIDVIEIDAASHGGVDDARDLRERAFFAPVHSRYKVYIVDEAHMVTAAGFNAMLKLVEEPPPHVKFIFATTEPEKVIGTIRSRTHHYPFRLVPPKLLSDYLGQLCEAEHIDVEPAVLPLVVRAGAGSVRDSLSVLDQLLGGASESGVSYQQATGLLGYTPDTLLDEILDAFAAGDAAGVFAAVDKVVEVGQDPRRFAEDLLRRLRDLVIVAAVPDAIASGLVAAADDQADRLRSQAAAMGAGELTRAAEVIALGLTEMRGTTAPRLYLELMCARVLLPGADVDDRGTHARLDRLEKRLDMVGAAPVGQQPTAETQRPEPTAAGGTDHGSAGVSPVAGPPQGESPRQRYVPREQAAVPGPAAQPAQPQPAPPVQQTPATQPGRPSAEQSMAEPDDDHAPPPPDDEPAPHGDPGSGAPTPDAAPAAQQTPGQSGGLSTAGVRQRWPEVIEELARRKKMTWILVSQNAHVSEVNNGQVTLGFHNAGARESFGRGGHTDILAEALIEVFGADLRISTIVDEAGPSASPKGEAALGAAAPSNTGNQPEGVSANADPWASAAASAGDTMSAPVSSRGAGEAAPAAAPQNLAPGPADESTASPGEPAQRADTVPTSAVAVEAGMRARQGIRPTRMGGPVTDEEPVDPKDLPDRSDSDVEDFGESHAELLSRHLGAEYIGEVDNT